MLKLRKRTLMAVSVFAVFATTLFVDINTNADSQLSVSFCQSAEANDRFWDDLRHDIRRDWRNDVRNETRRNIQQWEREQRNISRADGDPRFAKIYLSDRDVIALRTLKSLPVGCEITLEMMNSEVSSIRSMCNRLPEFSFVGYAKDRYGERIGCTVYRSKVIY